MSLLDNEIDSAARQYLSCCQKIASHSGDEEQERVKAHQLFLLVEELRHRRSTDLYRVV